MQSRLPMVAFFVEVASVCPDSELKSHTGRIPCLSGRFPRGGLDSIILVGASIKRRVGEVPVPDMWTGRAFCRPRHRRFKGTRQTNAPQRTRWHTFAKKPSTFA